MKRFHFRLQRFLNRQAKICSSEEEKLRLALRALWETNEKLAHLKAESVAMEQEWLKHRSFTARDLHALAAFRILVTKTERSLTIEHSKRTLVVEEQRKRVWAERRRFDQIQKMRERAVAGHNAAIDRETEVLALECHLSARTLMEHAKR
jgi:hypothetical protein